MKIKGLKISIFMLLLSICACGFILPSHKSIDVYAANNSATDCYYLLDDAGSAYQAISSVGSLEGLGNFVVGENNVELTATAKENYQFAGWKITYNEQDGKVEYFYADGLSNGSKTVTLTAKDKTDNGVDDPQQIEATLNFTEVGGYFTSGTFEILRVFEDITINPIFDHIYYNVKINDLINISSLENFIIIGDDVLYYSESANVEGVVEYKDSYIKKGTNYFYYGSVFAEDGEYYTVHKTLTETPNDEKVDYSKGAFRIGDVAKISLDVDIVEDDILTSKNVDVLGFSVTSASTRNLTEYKESSTSNYYKLEKDDYLRTSGYEVNFIVGSNANYVNTVNVTYHDLFVVDVNLLVDGSAEHDEDAEILGNTQLLKNELRSNLSIYNFYSIVELDNLCFLAKSAANNSSRAFGLNSVATITGTTGNGTYRYYVFSDIDGANNKSVYYSGLAQNIVINVNYSSVTYAINFGVAEYKIDPSTLNPVLFEMNVEKPNSLQLSRGESLLSGAVVPDENIGEVGDYYFDKTTTLIYEKLTSGWTQIQDYEGLEILGYEFVGFASSLTSPVENDYSYAINRVEPIGTEVWLCFKKVEYSVVLTNYNKLSIGDVNPLDLVTLTKVNVAGETNETLSSTDLVGESVELSDIKIVLGESLIITQKTNNGFSVKYSLLSPTEISDLINSGKTKEEMEAYYVNSFELTESFISSNVDGSRIIIYVYEEMLEYTITYFINVETLENGKYLMANIDVTDISEEQSNTNFSIVKYDLEGVEINADNNNLSAEVSRIVISGLYLSDSVTLISTPKPFDDTNYTFNWFIDGRTTLTYDEVNDNFNHTETISRTRTIQVVYSVPVAQVYISLDEDFANTPDFTYNYQLKVGGEIVEPVDSVLYPNQFTIRVGEVVNVTVGGLGFGYNFIGYQVNDKSINRVSGFSFNHTTLLGANEITLKFERIRYQFYFEQYGAIVDGEELSGKYVEFNGKEYIELNIDTTFTEVYKPEGYYVKSATIDGININANVENNIDFRSLPSNSVYGFNLSRVDFVNVITNFGVDNQNTEGGVGADGILEVYIRLDYLIYMYDLTISYTDPQGSPHDINVQYLNLQLNYVKNGQKTSMICQYASDRVVFEESIPYGAETVVNVLGTLQTGLKFSGWAYVDANLVSFSNGAKYLNLGSVTENKEFLYMFGFEAFKLVLDYNTQQGEPNVAINTVTLPDVTNIDIYLFDSIKINANAIRANGYKFSAFKVNKASYIPYGYEEDSWNANYLDLYILDGHAYVKNVSSEYDENLNYFTVIVEEQTFAETDEFSIEGLVFSDYALSGKNLIVTIEYELLQFSIINQTQESSDGGTLTHALLKDLMDFRVEELLVLTITAIDQSNETRIIDGTKTVTFYDAVSVKIEINKNATEYLSNKGYDLSLGVELIEVQVSGISMFLEKGQNKGEYFINFAVGQYMPESGEELNITYTIIVQQKNVFVITEVAEEYVNFYKNVYMYAVSDNLFGSKDSLGNPGLNTYWQFMAPLTSYVQMTETYLGLFRAAGVKVYLSQYNSTSGEFEVSSSPIDSSSYDEYGISVYLSERPDGSGISDYQVKIDNLLYNYRIVFQVQPIINYNGGPSFRKVFSCDSKGVSTEQKLSIGSNNNFDVQVASEIVDFVKIKYQFVKDGVLTGTEIESVKNVGEYKVHISFQPTADFDWLGGLTAAESVSLEITPKEIHLIYDELAVASNKVEREYNKSSSYNVASIFKFLIFTDGGEMRIRYESLLAEISSNLRLDTNIACYISSGGKDERIFQANESLYYNLYVYGIALEETEYNNNFKLVTEDLIINSYIQIKKLSVDLENIAVYSKVYDGTDVAELNAPDKIKLSEKISGDDVIIRTDKLVVKFEDYSVGENKIVLIDAALALGGADATNYSINNARIEGLTIYPYSISTKIKGIGEVKLFNDRGLVDKNLVNLIPIDATLEVEPIRGDTPEYAKIHGKISQHLKGNNEYSVGYRLTLMLNGQKLDIDKNLYLSIPKVKHVTGAYFLTGSKTDEIIYKSTKDEYIIDLSQTELEINSLFVTQKRILLKPWQIVLIVTSAVALVAAVVITFVIIRKRKFKEYSIHDKI